MKTGLFCKLYSSAFLLKWMTVYLNCLGISTPITEAAWSPKLADT